VDAHLGLASKREARSFEEVVRRPFGPRPRSARSVPARPSAAPKCRRAPPAQAPPDPHRPATWSPAPMRRLGQNEVETSGRACHRGGQRHADERSELVLEACDLLADEAGSGDRLRRFEPRPRAVSCAPLGR